MFTLLNVYPFCSVHWDPETQFALFAYKFLGDINYKETPIPEEGLQERWRGIFLHGHVVTGHGGMASNWELL